MNPLRAVPMFVQLLIFGIAISLGAFSIIPWWAAGILAILSFIVIFGGGSSAFRVRSEKHEAKAECHRQWDQTDRACAVENRRARMALSHTKL